MAGLWRKIGWIPATVLGSAVFALGFSLFLQNNGISPGGISGLGMVIVELLNIGTVGLWSIAINLPLFLLAGVKIGRRFFAGSLLGMLLSFMGNFSYTLVYLGIACFSLSLVFQLVTLPVEFNASRRAMEAIEQGNILSEEEQRGARKTLKAAAMTYVAAMAVALAQLIRLIVIFGNRRRRD